MSVCGHCGLALAEGAVTCEGCGAEVAPARSAGTKWGTLQISRPRPASGPIAAQPKPDSPPLTAADDALDLAKQMVTPPVLQPPAAPPARPQRGASRPLSGPLTPEAAAARHPATRGHGPAAPSDMRRSHARPQSAPFTAGVARAPSAPLSAGRAPARQPSRPLSAPLSVELPPAAAGEPANVNHLDTGLLDMDGRFGGALAEGPSLEVESLQPRRLEEPAARPARPQQRPQPQQPKPPPQQAEPSPESPAEQRQRRLRDLARYEPPPQKLLQTIPYALRVYARRRELEGQVANLTQQRKRLEVAHGEALAALGQALYGKRDNPKLSPLAAQLRVIHETAQEVGSKAAAAKRNEAELKQDLSSLERELADMQAKAAPVQAREQELRQTLESHRAEIKRREMLVRKADVELATLKASAEPEVLKKIIALEAERDEHYGEAQSLHVQVLPLEDDLIAIQADVAKFSVMLDGLEERKRRLLGAMDREQGRGRIASGGVQAAFREALRSLATGALRLELADLAPEERRAAADAEARAAAHRESEELMRAAVSCYDPALYRRGMQLLVGGVFGTFLLFFALIVF